MRKIMVLKLNQNYLCPLSSGSELEALNIGWRSLFLLGIPRHLAIAILVHPKPKHR